MLGVTSRIIFVNNGEEMKTMGPDLSMHFETNGTPIMIGESINLSIHIN